MEWPVDGVRCKGVGKISVGVRPLLPARTLEGKEKRKNTRSCSKFSKKSMAAPNEYAVVVFSLQLFFPLLSINQSWLLK